MYNIVSHGLFYKYTEHRKSPKIATGQKTVEKLSKLLQIDSFGDKNAVNSSNFNATILKFYDKFAHKFSHVFIFGNIFLRVAVSLQCRL